MSRPVTTPDKEQYVTHECEACGVKGGQYLKHYDICRCSCGKFWWALRPQRNGPLVAYPWPGLPRPAA